MLYKRNAIVALNSLAVALLINAQFLAYIANTYFGISSGIVSIVYVVVAMLVLFSSVFNHFKIKFKISQKTILFVGYILFYFLFSKIIVSGSFINDYLFDFITNGLLVLIISQRPLRKDFVLLFTMIIGTLFWINPNKYVSSSLLNISYDRASMVASYVLVPLILAAVFHFVFYRSNSKVLYLLYISNGALLVSVIRILGRGPLLSILVGICITGLIHYNQGVPIKKKQIGYIVAVILILVIGSNFFDILYAINDMLNQQGIQVAAIKKSVDLFANNGVLGVLNNRKDRWDWAFSMIKENPFFGSGIGEYANRYMTWPHNLFIHIWVEFGIIGAIPFIYALLKSIKITLFTKCDSDDIFFLGYLFSISIIRLMFSSYFWHHPEFWMFMFLGIIVSKKQSYWDRNREAL